MTELFARIPYWLLLDGGAKALPPAAHIALVYVAAAGGAIRCGDDPRGALDALSAGAGSSFDTMLTRGFVESLDGVLRLLPPPSHATESYDLPMAADDSEDAPVFPSRSHHGPPSRSPEAQRLRKVRSLFENRVGVCKDIPATVSWESWSKSPEGLDLLRVGRARGGARNKDGVVPSSKNKARNNQGTTKEQGKEQPPQTPPPDEENKRNDDETTTKGARGNNQGTGKEQPPQFQGTTPRNNPKEQPPDHPLVAALVATGGLVEPDYETARQLDDVLARVGLTPDLAAAWGKALATPPGRKISWPWLRSPDAPITAHFLRSADLTKGHEPWSRVGDGFSVWRAWDAKRRRAHAKAAAPSPLLPTVPDDPATAAARMRALNAQVLAARTAPPQAPTAPETSHG